MLGKAIKEMRKRRRMTRTQLAREAGVSRELIRKIEDKGQNTTVKTLKKLGRVLGVDFLIGDSYVVVRPNWFRKLQRKLSSV